MNTAKALGVIMGVQADVVKKVARVYCKGGDNETTKKFLYAGIPNCRAATLIAGGDKTCPYGCVGLGTCAVVCPFDAIRMENGLPLVDEDKCTGCGKCEKACPKYTIRVVPADTKFVVRCNSIDRGAVVRKYCSAGCIGCGACVKACPSGAITMSNNLAFINFEKCTNCGLCVPVCPTKNIDDYLKKGLSSGRRQPEAADIIEELKQLPVTCRLGALFYSFPDVIYLHRLIKVVKRPYVYGIKICFYLTISCHHYKLRLRFQFSGLPDQCQAVHFRHLQVCDYEAYLFILQDVERLYTRVGAVHNVPLSFKYLVEKETSIFLIIYDKDVICIL